MKSITITLTHEEFVRVVDLIENESGKFVDPSDEDGVEEEAFWEDLIKKLYDAETTSLSAKEQV